MRNEAMLKDFIELVTTDAVTGEEDKVAAKLTEKLEALGFTVTMDDAGEKLGSTCGNLIAVRDGALDGSLLFSSHMDRMPNGFGIHPVEKDGVIYSDGTTILAADDMAGACVILNGLRESIVSGKPLQSFQIGDGLMNGVSPFNGVTISSTQMCKVDFRRWLKWYLPRCVILYIVEFAFLYLLTVLGWH